MRPPEPDPLLPPCGRHKWMAPKEVFEGFSYVVHFHNSLIKVIPHLIEISSRFKIFYFFTKQLSLISSSNYKYIHSINNIIVSVITCPTSAQTITAYNSHAVI